jgi:hypothetical protein
MGGLKFVQLQRLSFDRFEGRKLDKNAHGHSGSKPIFDTLVQVQDHQIG